MHLIEEIAPAVNLAVAREQLPRVIEMYSKEPNSRSLFSLGVTIGTLALKIKEDTKDQASDVDVLFRRVLSQETEDPEERLRVSETLKALAPALSPETARETLPLFLTALAEGNETRNILKNFAQIVGILTGEPPHSWTIDYRIKMTTTFANLSDPDVREELAKPIQRWSVVDPEFTSVIFQHWYDILQISYRDFSYATGDDEREKRKMKAYQKQVAELLNLLAPAVSTEVVEERLEETVQLYRQIHENPDDWVVTGQLRSLIALWRIRPLTEKLFELDQVLLQGQKGNCRIGVVRVEKAVRVILTMEGEDEETQPLARVWFNPMQEAEDVTIEYLYGKVDISPEIPVVLLNQFLGLIQEAMGEAGQHPWLAGVSLKLNLPEWLTITEAMMRGGGLSAVLHGSVATTTVFQRLLASSERSIPFSSLSGSRTPPSIAIVDLEFSPVNSAL